MDKTARLLAALDKDTELLFHVQVAVHDKKIAGPWQKTMQAYRERRSAKGKRLARVTKTDADRYLQWEARLAKEFGEDRKRNFRSEGEALKWADEKLQGGGYRLVGGAE